MDNEYGFPVTYDQSFGLMRLIELAVGSANHGNINPDITPEHFTLPGTDVRKRSFRVEPAKGNREQIFRAADRLVADGHILGNIGDLAGFFHNHPREVAKWWCVFALSVDSRWSSEVGDLGYAPCARMNGSYRDFGLRGLRGTIDFRYGILVECK